VAGSLAGALIGFLLAFLRALFTFHVQDLETGQSYWLSLRFFPVLDALLWFVIALAVGVVLSVVAAIYPAIRAARMEPVQAMRVEA
jgi:ABC-type antimicrobial peptide transport system permease subunit